ncbi:hypothetical protein N0V93_003471 [Gnomoniopsis smithogilvyi]|uniref:DNA mismatch repair protein MSH5 n=1 Tax=Gnomoniopsis smithogilvyi TaxID=1191159 RepID=A0A9W8YYE7_9PEZI|nr:hypothetical protein N0V93_003471 [Gnomoniopsis smithogilvyi]
MAIDMKDNGTVGSAYYVAIDEAVFLQEDVPMAGIEFVETLLLRVEPTTVLISLRSPDSLVEFLEAGAQDFQGNREGDFHGAYILRTLGSSAFNYDSAKKHLMNLEFEALGSHTMHFNTVAEEAEGGIEDQTNSCGQDALASLQILGSENHPNHMNQGPDGSKSGAKESLSLYGLFHVLTHTFQGKVKLRQMFLRPSVDLDLIHERQRTIAVFLRPENNADIIHICKTLRKVKNIKNHILQLKSGVNLPGGPAAAQRSTWATLQAFSAYTIDLREAVRKLKGAERLAITSAVVDGVSPNVLRRVGERIATTIDFQQSKEARRMCVLPDVDPQLDELKRNYDGLENFLNDVAAHLIAEIPEWARLYVKNCIFYPQIGFLTVVSLDPETGRGKYEGEGVDGDAWESMFVTDGDIYCKNKRMRELDTQYGDLYCMIVDREIEIVHELGVEILGHEQALATASDLCGDLDSLLALALGADKYRLTAPQMTSANVIHIQGGRHPLQELVVPSFIANDTLLLGGLGDEQDDRSIITDEMRDLPSVMVMTGPNHSGKSVYLKQVALIVFLAHIGAFVPADAACIGLTDRLLTRIATRESVSRNESAFAIDLKQAAFSINLATRRSLILLDEFGKGTNSMDGAGLVTALLHHFVNLGDEAPKVLAATHFHEIFEQSYLRDAPRLSLAHMDVRVDFEAEDSDDQVICLFRLAAGRSTSSFGGRCAAMNGVDGAVVQRADAIALLLARGEDLRAACARLTEQETERLEKAELIARDFLEMDFSNPLDRVMINGLLLNSRPVGSLEQRPRRGPF